MHGARVCRSFDRDKNMEAHFHVEPTDVTMLDIMEVTSSIEDDAKKNFKILVTRIFARNLFCPTKICDGAAGAVSLCTGVPKVLYCTIMDQEKSPFLDAQVLHEGNQENLVITHRT